MLEALTAASNSLYSALEEYSSICSEIQRSYARGEKPHLNCPQLPRRMEAEARLAMSLEFQLRKAVAAINWSRNQSNTRVNINDLPSELLARIFYLAHGAQPCAKRSDDYYEQRKAGPVLPTALTLVCSRWREVAISTPTLWSHIDLSTSTPLNRQCFDGLMGLHVNQAGPLPLYLHIFDSYANNVSWKRMDLLKRSITQLASRTVSFELDIRDFFHCGRVYCEIISSFFKNCTPGKLTQLTLVMPRPDYHVVLMCNDNHNVHDETLDLPTEELEIILSHVTVLRLSQLFLPWNSRAYHGLVELRLTGYRLAIPESELIGLLRSSPDLRILQLSLKTLDPLPTDSQINPVQLKNLEVLNLVGVYTEVGMLLRWLAPGPKSLQFAMRSGLDELIPQLKETSTRLFFSHACITRMFGSDLSPAQILCLLNLVPSLQEMAVQIREDSQSVQWEVPRLASERQLECLHIIFCRIRTEAILALLNAPALTIKNVSFYNCRSCIDDELIPEDHMTSYLGGIAQACPRVRFIVRSPEEPNPIADWNLFEWYEESQKGWIMAEH